MLVIDDLQVKLFTEGGALPVLNHINLSVRPGEIVGIVGESGCGKSMLASSVMGLIQSPGVSIKSSHLQPSESHKIAYPLSINSYLIRLHICIFQEELTEISSSSFF
ncbi:MAG: ATP-binding cassette domain-containing protein, partial [Clostridia bacterium]|nr:ATP-binding cassette domain-containing protein [Clostridia bacterium]